MVFENHRKSLIQHCEQSKLHLFEACGQTVLPDMSKGKNGEKCQNQNETF